MTEAQALEAIRAAGFTPAPPAYDEASPETTGTVVSQTPRAGERAGSDGVVAFTLAGPPPVEVPALVGVPAAEASATLESIGLTLRDERHVFSATVAAGSIVSQTPLPGTSTPVGSSVFVHISRGPEPVPIPNVMGKQETEAVGELEKAGFRAAVAKRSSSAAKGVVIEQTPATGKAVPGTSVAISVSTGVEMVRVPNARNFHGSYDGDDWGRVLASLEAAIVSGFRKAGLKASVEFANGYDQGGDIRQDPKPGALVPKGTRVKVVVPVYD